jgi:hypothetical protein
VLPDKDPLSSAINFTHITALYRHHLCWCSVIIFISFEG